MPPPEEEGGKTQINGFQDLSSHGRKSFRSNFVAEGGEKERVGGFLGIMCPNVSLANGSLGKRKGGLGRNKHFWVGGGKTLGFLRLPQPEDDSPFLFSYCLVGSFAPDNGVRESTRWGDLRCAPFDAVLVPRQTDAINS